MIRMAGRLAAMAVGALVGLGFALEPSDAQTPGNGTVAFTGARIIDGTGKAIENGTVVVTNGRITAVGPSASVTVPAGVTTINSAGKTIIPGLINGHGHVTIDDYTKLPPRPHMLQILQAYAEYGITTTTSLGSTTLADETEQLKIRDEQRKGTPPDRARLFSAGMNAIGANPQEARQSVVRLANVKADLIKYHINGNAKDMTPDTYGAIVDESIKRGLITTVHIFNLKDAKGAIEKGTNSLVHSVRDQDVDQELIDMMKRNNVSYIPTLTRDLSVFVYETEPAFWQEPFFQKGMYVYKTQVDILKDAKMQQEARNSPAVQRIKVALQQANRNLKRLSDAGITIGMGTDTASPNDLGRWPGYFEHTEMEMMVQAGMTPMQVLVAATSGNARIFKLDNNVGSIAVGKEADLVVLNANPLDNIRNTRQIDSVWIGGRRIPASR